MRHVTLDEGDPKGETSCRNLVGNQSDPAKVSHQPEASLAWPVGGTVTTVTGTNFRARSVDSECEAMASKPHNLTQWVGALALGRRAGQHQDAETDLAWRSSWGHRAWRTHNRFPTDVRDPVAACGNAGTGCEATSVRLGDGESERTHSTDEAGELSP